MLKSRLQPPKNRRDHYLPVGYLKGFIDPARISLDRPLWCWEVEKRKWAKKSPKEVGYKIGLYDFAIDPVDAEHADITFNRLEDEFPVLRDKLVRTQFRGWVQYLPFLCTYMQMIRARSPLYFLQKKVALATTRVHQITSVDPNQNRVTLDSMEGRLMTGAEKHNHTLSLMRTEIQRGVDWMGEFQWTLRTTANPEDPVTTGEQPLTVRADWQRPEPLKQVDSFVFFPLCWQACLVGNRLPFPRDIEPFASDKLRAYRRIVLDGAREFVVSPQQVDD